MLSDYGKRSVRPRDCQVSQQQKTAFCTSKKGRLSGNQSSGYRPTNVTAEALKTMHNWLEVRFELQPIFGRNGRNCWMKKIRKKRPNENKASTRDITWRWKKNRMETMLPPGIALGTCTCSVNVITATQSWCVWYWPLHHASVKNNYWAK